jgi:hypothetical protein
MWRHNGGLFAKCRDDKVEAKPGEVQDLKRILQVLNPTSLGPLGLPGLLLSLRSHYFCLKDCIPCRSDWGPMNPIQGTQAQI